MCQGIIIILIYFLSPVEQLVNQIGNDESNERDYEIIAYIVYESFSFDELLELDALSVHDSRLKYILEEYPPNWNYASFDYSEQSGSSSILVKVC
ncbi:hypothetical protein [Sphingobacterium composti Ten et al. 2007 non Yoo et al. 2007]|uniref:hypothetical protein n=1 Tax=Sphingobacterium composti TaxID=363260 RepID=UPI001359B6D1|nr:hypothetical protein [Sphingobacterium composti Ten et al. 2007 non Yoo et al. 2007]